MYIARVNNPQNKNSLYTIYGNQSNSRPEPVGENIKTLENSELIRVTYFGHAIPL